MLWIVVEVHFVLPVGVVSTQHRLLKRSLSSVGSLVHLRQQPGAHVCVVLLLGPRGRPGAVCLSPPGSTQSRLLKSESEISDSSPFTLFKNCVSCSGTFTFPYTFQNALVRIYKSLTWVVIEVSLSLQVSSGRSDPFTLPSSGPRVGQAPPRCRPVSSGSVYDPAYPPSA